jgi:calcineurin-like phosphoesterase family protein
MNGQPLFSWIHLSDIHIGHGDAGHRANQSLVLNALREDIAQGSARNLPPPDAILVTGDIAFSGNGVIRAPDKESREYERAQAFLLDVAREVGRSAREIFVVPGNHDVNRATNSHHIWRLVDMLRKGDEPLDEILNHEEDRALLTKRMAAYLEFASGFAPACLAAPAPLDQRLFWVHRFSSRGLAIRLVGLNTALLSSGDDDMSKLRLGNRQLEEAFTRPPVSKDELVIVLSHHPLHTGWLADGRDADRWVRKSAHVHLSGHVHDLTSEETRAGGSARGFVRIVAGAAHGERVPEGATPDHGYSWAAVTADDDGSLWLQVWPRRWSDKNRDFRVDRETVLDGAEFARHALSVKLPGALPAIQAVTPGTTPSAGSDAALPAVTTSAAPPLPKPASPVATAAPVEVFISSCPDDDELRLKLEKQFALLKKSGQIKITGNRTVSSGESYADAVQAQLRSAKIVLILLSADYLAWEHEADLEIAREQQQKHGVRVIPILLRSTDMGELRTRDDTGRMWFEKLVRLPRNHRPVTSWSNQDEAFTEIAKELRALLEALRAAGR